MLFIIPYESNINNSCILIFLGEYLKNRSYRGLEANVGQDEAAEIQEGLSGIARGYVNEKEGDDNDDEE